jgi:hypothetical protein
MALREVLVDTVIYAKQPVSDTDFIKLYNMATRDLASKYDTAKRKVTTAFTDTVINTWYALTAGCVGVTRVLDSEGYIYTKWSVRDATHIAFEDSGTYSVYETMIPTKVVTMASIETINSHFNMAIVKYIASKIITPISPAEGEALKQEYMEDAALANKAIRNARTRYMTVGTAPYR